MKIERMTSEDIKEIALLEQNCFSQPWSERVLETELLNPHAFFYTARIDGDLAGYIGMHCVLDEGYIANVAVENSYRRNGVATGLMETLFEHAREHKLGFVTLEVRETNAPAIAFYRKMGFGEAGRRRGFYANPPEDAILMTAFLTTPEALEQK